MSNRRVRPVSRLRAVLLFRCVTSKIDAPGHGTPGDRAASAATAIVLNLLGISLTCYKRRSRQRIVSFCSLGSSLSDQRGLLSKEEDSHDPQETRRSRGSDCDRRRVDSGSGASAVWWFWWNARRWWFCRSACWRLRRLPWRVRWASRLCRTIGVRQSWVLSRPSVRVLSTSPVHSTVLRRRSTLCRRLFVVLDLGANGLRLATSLGVQFRLRLLLKRPPARQSGSLATGRARRASGARRHRLPAGSAPLRARSLPEEDSVNWRPKEWHKRPFS